MPKKNGAERIVFLLQFHTSDIAILRKKFSFLFDNKEIIRNNRQPWEILHKKQIPSNTLQEHHLFDLSTIIIRFWYALCSNEYPLRGGRRLHEPDPASNHLAAFFILMKGHLAKLNIILD